MADPLREKLEAGLHRHQSGDLAGAEDIYREVLSADPDHRDATHFLGLIALQQGAVDQAIDLIERAIALAPDRPTFHANLGAALLAAGNDAGALAAYRETVRLEPDNPDALQTLGSLLGKTRQFKEAETVLRQALTHRPDFPEALCTLAAALNGLNRANEAAEAARRATELSPGLADAWTNLGNALERLKQPADAEAAHRRAIEADPAVALPHYNLGNLLNYSWRTEDGIKELRTALEIDPDYTPAQGNLLLNLLYVPDQTEETLFWEHTRWMSRQPATGGTNHANDPDPNKRLRIGYVSPDFRTHSCAYFLEPLLTAHDKEAVEIFAYADVEHKDEMTRRLRSHTHHWRDIWGLSDEAAADLIREDGIDILVDLAGHSANNRLGLFALKPAPVQVAWLGYPVTTGLNGIGYRLTDDIADPPGEADQWHSEELIRLEGGFHCYEGPVDAPEIAPLLNQGAGGITFGSFNNISKITPATVSVWAKILTGVQGSKLMLKGRMLDNEIARDRLRAAFEDCGVSADRLDLRQWIPRDQSPLSLYDEVDIALDTFPYNGTTTTFEALWMGVPVVSMTGSRHAARVGASILQNIGLPELITETEEQYVATAINLAGKADQRETMRLELRDRLKTSSLGDAAGFAAKIEVAYQNIWQSWCRKA